MSDSVKCHSTCFPLKSLKATLEERKEIDSSTNAGLRGSFENLKLKLHERLLRPRADPTIPSDVDKSTSTVNTKALLQYNRNTDEKREQ